MKEKHADIITLFLLLILGVFYFLSAQKMGEVQGPNTLGAGYFPTLLAVLLFILCIVSLVQRLLKKDDKKIEIPNFGKIIITIVCTALYIALWDAVGNFILLTFILLVALFFVYRWNHGFTKRNLLLIFSTALVTTALIYVLFVQVLSIQFT